MVITPALRGLFGLDWDALHRTIRLAPHLPAAWDKAALRNVPLAGSRVDLEFVREGERLRIRAHAASGETVCLAPQAASPTGPCRAELVLPLPAVEIGMPAEFPLPGSATADLKAVGESRTANHLEVDFEAPGGSEQWLPVRLNRPKVQLLGGEIAGGKLHLRFPAGNGYQRRSVSFTW
jgi:hypothetical protein